MRVKAFVRGSIYVKPRYGREDQSVITVIQIRAGLGKDLRLEPGQFNLEGKLAYSIEGIYKGRKIKAYLTTITGVAGSYRGFLNSITNNDEKPVLNIRISGRFVKAKTGKQ